MSSKACGEPSLLLSVSVLHACRNAAAAAHSQLTQLTSGTLSPVSTLTSPLALTAASEDSGESDADGRSDSAASQPEEVTCTSTPALGTPMLVLEAPASPSRLKQVM